jgi:hypothetical protein
MEVLKKIGAAILMHKLLHCSEPLLFGGDGVSAAHIHYLEKVASAADFARASTIVQTPTGSRTVRRPLVLI